MQNNALMFMHRIYCRSHASSTGAINCRRIVPVFPTATPTCHVMFTIPYHRPPPQTELTGWIGKRGVQITGHASVHTIAFVQQTSSGLTF